MDSLTTQMLARQLQLLALNALFETARSSKAMVTLQPDVLAGALAFGVRAEEHPETVGYIELKALESRMRA